MTPKRKKAERLADEELMPLIGDRDPQAFAVFYDRHGGVDKCPGPSGLTLDRAPAGPPGPDFALLFPH
jgi:hypothetical protein